MTNELIELKCVNCGARELENIGNDTYWCKYCGARELENLGNDTYWCKYCGSKYILTGSNFMNVSNPHYTSMKVSRRHYECGTSLYYSSKYEPSL
jgi:DNA-directed RNA polymerase subunit RPC12/RpoP